MLVGNYAIALSSFVNVVNNVPLLPPA